MDMIPRTLGFLPFLLFTIIHSVSPDAGKSETNGYPMMLTAGTSSTSGVEYDPYNLTISHLTSRSVQVSWSCKSQNLHDKYEVTLKPLKASYRVIETVPYNTCYLTMDKLEPDSDYQVSVTSISGRVRKRSSSVIFRTYSSYTLEDYTDEILEDEDDEKLSKGNDGSEASEEDKEQKIKPSKDRLKLPRVRLVEISLVGMALVLWAGAIVLFFHRWGKIRMLLPYQPDYKEMKRNNSVCANCSMTPHHQCCRLGPMQHQAIVAECHGGTSLGGSLPGPSTSMCHTSKPERTSVSVACAPVTDKGCSPIRPRLNSFIVYDMKETGGRAHHQQQTVCRKSRSAEQLQQYNCSNQANNTNYNNLSSESETSTTTDTTPNITSSSTTPYMDECSIDMDLVYTDF